MGSCWGPKISSSYVDGMNKLRAAAKISTNDYINYKIIKYQECKGNILVLIQYKNCLTYEGYKVMIYLNCKLNDLLVQNMLDPHFSTNKDFLSPFARFEPTDLGWAAGRHVLENF